MGLHGRKRWKRWRVRRRYREGEGVDSDEEAAILRGDQGGGRGEGERKLGDLGACKREKRSAKWLEGGAKVK